MKVYVQVLKVVSGSVNGLTIVFKAMSQTFPLI